MFLQFSGGPDLSMPTIVLFVLCSGLVSLVLLPQGLGDVKGPCPQGYYCPAGAPKKLPCPRGTYGAASGLSSESECTPCEAGKYCFGKGLDQPSGPCRAGYYCAGSSKYPAPEV